MMNYKEWSTRKFWIVIVGVFILGAIIFSGPKSSPKEITKEVIKEVPAQCDYSTWKRLKEVDDRGFGYCVKTMELCSQGFTAISNLDVAGIQRVTNDMNRVVPNIEATASERQTILSKLGY